MKRLQEELLKRKLDCAIFLSGEKPDANCFYLTGYTGAGVLVIPAVGKPILHAPSRDTGLAEKVKGVVLTDGNRKLSEVLKEKSIACGKVGICFDTLLVSDFNKLKEKLNCEFSDLSSFMKGLRACKNSSEIAKIRTACKITDEIIGKFVKNFKKFKTEEEVVAFLVYETRLRGCDLAFEPIVASGVNAAVPHHVSHGKINRGFCVVDFGVKYKGYCSDVTRTFYIGVPTASDRKLYFDLLKVQEDSINNVEVGAEIASLHNDAKKILGDKFIHSLGHGLGIDVHEEPYVSSSTKGVLKEGMIITIEPGVYVPGKYGIRIEDDVVVTANGAKVLSKFSKELIVIGDK